jgi:hypothetical protein
MRETIVFPDATAVVIGILADQLTAPVYGAVPPTRPAAFVVVRRVGGPERNLVVDEPMLTIEAWADAAPAAMALAELARAHVKAAQGTVADGIPVYRVRDVAGPAFLPDPESTQPRVTQTVMVQLRGTPI